MRGKLVNDLKEAIRLAGLEDGMTISFHHHLRNGDMVAVMVMEAICEMGIFVVDWSVLGPFHFSAEIGDQHGPIHINAHLKHF